MSHDTLKKASESIFSEAFAKIPVALLIEWERPVTHARRGRDGREEGCESGYYDLHRDLDDSLFHDPCFLFGNNIAVDPK